MPSYGKISPVKINPINILQVCEIIEITRDNAKLMWSLTKSQSLWLPEKESAIKGISKQHEETLENLLDFFLQYGTDMVDGSTDLRLARKRFVEDEGVCYSSMCARFVQTWEDALHPEKGSLRLASDKARQVHKSFHNWCVNTSALLEKLEEVVYGPPPSGSRPRTRLNPRANIFIPKQ